MAFANFGIGHEGHFPGLRSDDRGAAREQVKRELAAGQSVSGIVVLRRPFGVFVDIGSGFPVRLEIPEIAGLTPERSWADDWCPEGSPVTARVMGFRDSNRQIIVSQTKSMPGMNLA